MMGTQVQGPTAQERRLYPTFWHIEARVKYTGTADDAPSDRILPFLCNGTIMHPGYVAMTLVILLLIGTAGCLSTTADRTAPTPAPTQTVVAVATANPPGTLQKPSDMALQLADLPGDYIVKERSERAYEEMSQLSRDLGWRQGYAVTFYRMNREMFDMTALSQSVDLYPVLAMNRVFDMAKERMDSTAADGSYAVYELPLGKIGDASIAYKTEDTRASNSPVYTIIFVKKDVFEEISMGGTTTDFEALKVFANIAAEKIR